MNAKILSLAIVGVMCLSGLSMLQGETSLYMPSPPSRITYTPQTSSDYLTAVDSALDYLYPLWNESGNGYVGDWAKDYCPDIYSATAWASSTTTTYVAANSCDNSTGTRWIGLASEGSWTIYQNYTNAITFYQMRLFMNWASCSDGTTWNVTLYYSDNGADWTSFDTLNRTMSDDDMGVPVNDNDHNNAWSYMDMRRFYPGFITATYLKMEVGAWPVTGPRFGLWEWGPYDNVIETWPSAWALSSYAIKAGNGLANATEITRAQSIIDSMTTEDNWTRSGDIEPITHSWADAGATRHAAATLGALEGLYYAWKYQTELGLSSSQVASIKSAANASAEYSSLEYWQEDNQAFMWCWSILRLAYEMTGESNATMMTAYADSVTYKLGAAFYDSFTTDYAFKYETTTYGRFHAPEYSLIMYGGVLTIPYMQTQGFRELTSEEQDKILGWQQSCLLRWAQSGVLNWNSDNGVFRIYVTQYILWSMRSLFSMLAVTDLNLGDSDNEYARYLMDKFLIWWANNDGALVPYTDTVGRSLYLSDPSDGVPPAQTILQIRSDQRTYDCDKSVVAAMFSSMMLIAFDEGWLDQDGEESDGWVVYHDTRGEVAVSTQYYTTSILTSNYWAGYTKAQMPWNGISAHKLMDSEGFPVFEYGVNQSISQSFSIYDAAESSHSIKGTNESYSLSSVLWNGVDLTVLDDYDDTLLPRTLDYVYVSSEYDTVFPAYDLSTTYQFFENAYVMDEAFEYTGIGSVSDGSIVKTFPLRNYSLEGVYVGLTNGSEYTILSETMNQSKDGLGDISYIRIEYVDGSDFWMFALALTNGTNAQICTARPDLPSDVSAYGMAREYALFMNHTLEIYLAKNTTLSSDYQMTFLCGFINESFYSDSTLRLGRNVLWADSECSYHDNTTETGITATVSSGQVNMTVDYWSPGGGSVTQWDVDDNITGTVSYIIEGLDSSTGYLIYQDGEVISTGTGPTITFTATGGGEFEVVVWNTKTVSTLIVLTVNMVGLGIMVSVVFGWVLPFSRSIKKGSFRTNDQMTKELLKGVVFIVVGMFMYSMLWNVAIG